MGANMYSQHKPLMLLGSNFLPFSVLRDSEAGMLLKPEGQQGRLVPSAGPALPGLLAAGCSCVLWRLSVVQMEVQALHGLLVGSFLSCSPLPGVLSVGWFLVFQN